MPLESNLEQFLKNLSCGPEGILPALQYLQHRQGYIPREAIEKIAHELKVPLVQVFALATFYRRLSLFPRGKHHLEICLGTACHVQGGLKLLQEVVRKFRLSSGLVPGTYFHPEKILSVETVRCLGCCSLGPVIRLDGQIQGKMAPGVLIDLLKETICNF